MGFYDRYQCFNGSYGYNEKDSYINEEEFYGYSNGYGRECRENNQHQRGCRCDYGCHNKDYGCHNKEDYTCYERRCRPPCNRERRKRRCCPLCNFLNMFC